MLNDNSFLINFEATSKKHLLNELCKLANKNFNIDERVLIENLTKREKQKIGLAFESNENQRALYRLKTLLTPNVKKETEASF